MTQYIKPDPNCKACYGTGVVTDWVPTPFGNGNCRMETFCNCVEEQANDEDDIEIVEVAQ